MAVRPKRKMENNSELTLVCLCSLSIRIIKALNADELSLFSERIRFLDKKIQPGLSKLHWSTKGTASAFINDCRVHSNKVSHFWNTHTHAHTWIDSQIDSVVKSLCSSSRQNSSGLSLSRVVWISMLVQWITTDKHRWWSWSASMSSLVKLMDIAGP